MSEPIRRLSLRQLLNVAMGVAVLSFAVSSTAFAGMAGGNGCKMGGCDAGGGYNSGFCDYDQPTNGCNCFPFGGGSGEGTCACSTGEYPPCPPNP
jgi:hypothetical protein